MRNCRCHHSCRFDGLTMYCYSNDSDTDCDDASGGDGDDWLDGVDDDGMRGDYASGDEIICLNLR